MKFLLIFYTLLSLPFSSLASDCDVKLVKQIESKLNLGKKIMILAWSEEGKCEDYDETCGDWASYLNEFAVKQGKMLEVIKVPAKDWAKVISIKYSKIPEHSAIFIKKGKTTYFYSGPILEAQTYTTILNSWAGKPLKDVDDSLKKIDLNFCK
ncbi:MAG: hypothetical protein KDD34_05545 [Bdellovibrionales bacterium]|nr:hypothetical protein [Bdellovibrionales bacterium]